MIKRETYMSRIRPFMGKDLIKVMTGMRRSGKSVMLELIQEELEESGISRDHFISINFLFQLLFLWLYRICSSHQYQSHQMSCT